MGSRLGMVRYEDGTLHYTINGEDQGVACHNIPPGVFAVVDLYGQVKRGPLLLLQSLFRDDSSPRSYMSLGERVGGGGGG